MPDFSRYMRVERMGCVSYSAMHDLQKQRVQEIKDGVCDDTLFLLEHNPVITCGKNTQKESLVSTLEELEVDGIKKYDIGRGGDITYHGPGQLVSYMLFHLQEGERDVRRFITLVEEIMIQTALDFSIKAHRREGFRGVWVEDKKLGSVGVRISRWVTMHGLAFNVNTNLNHFSHIVPCGIKDIKMTSLKELLKNPPLFKEVENSLVEHTSKIFSRYYDTVEKTPLPILEKSSLETNIELEVKY